jgi:WD40 repeat protein
MDAQHRQVALEQARKGNAQALDKLLESYRLDVAAVIAAHLQGEGSQTPTDPPSLVEDALEDARDKFPLFTRTTVDEFVVWLRNTLARFLSLTAPPPATISSSGVTQLKECSEPPTDEVEEPLPEQIGRYRILGSAGAGGMGRVYKAHDPELDRVVAVKVPKLDSCSKDRAGWVRRFLREARSAASIRHPHVCPIYDVGEHDRVPYVVMAFIEGPSLAQQLQGTHPYDDPAVAVRLVRQVAEALEAIHAHGLVHRDLKPANILIDRKGQALLTDFGLARPKQDSEHLTDENALIGTPAFMSPEQTLGDSDQVSSSSDLYSLGVVLYSLLTGRLPFQGPAATILWQIGHEKPPPPTMLRPGLDPELEAIVQKTMAVQPEDRYQSARQIIEALDDWVTRGTGSPSPPIRRDTSQDTMNAAAATQDFPRAVEGQERGVRSQGSGVRNQGSGVRRQGSGVGRGQRKRRYGAVVVALLLVLVGGWFLAGSLWNRGKDNGKKPPKDEDPPRLEAMSAKALAAAPRKLDGLRSWTLETQVHRGAVFALASSPDGKRLAAAGDDGMVRLWDRESGQLLRILIGHDGAIRGLAWSPRGSRLASAGEDGTVRLWDTETGLLLRTLRGERGNTRAVAWSPDAETVAAGGEDGKVRLWQTADGGVMPTTFQLEGAVTALAWSPNGKALAAAGRDRLVRLWSVALGRAMNSLAGHELPHLSALAWSPASKALASAGHDGKVHVWDVEAGQSVRRVEPGVPVTALAWSPDGKTLCTGSNAGVQTWDETGKLVATLGQHNRIVHALTWSADGTVVSAGEDRVVRFWGAGNRPALIGHPGGASVAAWSPDGRLLVLAGFHDRSLRLWDAATGQFRLLPGQMGGWDRAVAFSPDGEILATAAANGAIQLWRLPGMKKLDLLVGHAVQILCLTFSPDGKTLASGGADGALRLWDMKTSKGRVLLQDQAGGVFALSWSPDGERLACGLTPDVQIVRVQGAKVEQVLESGAGPTRVVCWSPGGETLITADGWVKGNVHFWKTGGDWGRKRTAPGHEQGVFAGAWSADGALFASGGADAALRWWEGEGGQAKIISSNPIATVASLSWRGKERFLAWTSEDGTVRLGDPGDGRPRLLLLPLADGQGLVVDAEGHYCCSPEVEAGLIHVIQTERGQETLTPAEFAKQFAWKNQPAQVRLAEK